MGNVKDERWELKAQAIIDKLPTKLYPEGGKGWPLNNDSDYKCLVCQCEYEDGESTTFLQKCKHSFHTECVSGWLGKKDCCPYCRTCIVDEESEE